MAKRTRRMAQDNDHINAKTRALVELGVLGTGGEREAIDRAVQSAIEYNATADEIAMAVCVGEAIRAYAKLLGNILHGGERDGND